MNTRSPRRGIRISLLAAVLLLAAPLHAATLAEQIARLDQPENFDAVVKVGEPALEGLKGALKSPRADLAVQALGRMKLPGAVPSLLTLADDKDGELRAAVAWALGECGSTAPSTETCAAVSRLAADPYPPARAAAVMALARFPASDAGCGAAIEASIKRALSDADEQTRLAAVNAVCAGNRKDLFNTLTPLLDFHIEWIKPSESKDAKPKQKESKDAPANPEKPVLVESVVWKEPSSQVRLGVINALAALKVSDSLPALITALERETSFNRQTIVKTLEASGDKAGTAGVCLGRIVPLPYDRESFDKYMPILVNNGTLAVIAGRLGDERCIPYLLETLKLPHQKLGGDKDMTELFIQTVELLGKYKVERAARALVGLLKEIRIKQMSQALQTSIRQIGHTAARPLAAFGNEGGGDDWQMAPTFFRLLREPGLRTRAARDTIVKYINHESDEVRMEATETLGLYLYEGLLDEYDVPMLEAMYLDSNREVRASCGKWKAKLAEKHG